jgi:hypothetical protein
LHPANPAVLVDLDEPVGIRRDTGDRTAAKRGKCEHALNLDAPARGLQ